LFHAAAVPEASLAPFRAFPSRRSLRPLSGPACSLAVIPWQLERDTCDRITGGFPRRLRPPGRSCRVPPPTMGSLSKGPADRSPPDTTSRSPRVAGTGVVPPASFTCFEALIPPRVRSRRPGSPRDDGRCSPGLPAPLKPSLPTPRNLDPPRPKPEHSPRPQAQRATPGTSRPPQSGEGCHAPKLAAALVGDDPTRCGSARATLVAIPSPLTFLLAGVPANPGLRSIEVRRKQRFSAEIACSSGVSASSSTSRPRDPRRSWRMS